MYRPTNQIKVVDSIDHFTKNPTQALFDHLFEGEQGSLMLESVDMEDLQAAYMGEMDYIPDMMLEAIKSKASRLKSQVKRLSLMLGKFLKPLGIDVEDVEISKPRKSGAVAIQVAKIVLSDGQSTSLVFHAPDGDPLKINSNDTLIAFRFLVNSRDVTHVVAPSGGRDVSLKQVTLALSNMIGKNAPKFAQAQEAKKAQEAELSQAKEQIDALEAETEALTGEMAALEAGEEKNANRVKQLQTQIDTQNEIQADLQAQIDAKKVSGPDYEARYQDRVARIEKATTLEEGQAALDEEYADSERHMEGTGKVENALKILKSGLKAKQARESEARRAEASQQRFAAGEWVRIEHADYKDLKGQNYTGGYSQSERAAESVASTLSGYNSDLEYRVVSDYIDAGTLAYFVEKRIKQAELNQDDAAMKFVSELFKQPKLKAATEAVRKDGNGDVVSSLLTIAQIDNGGQLGMERSLFVSSLANKVKRMHKNGNQDQVDNILTMLNEYNQAAKKPAVTLRNAIFKLGEPKSVVTDEPTPESNDKKLYQLRDSVPIGDGVFILERIGVNSADFVDRETGSSFRMTADELTQKGIYIQGLNDVQAEAESTDKPAVLIELLPLIKDLNKDKWFDGKGRTTFDLFDDIYDVLRANNYDLDTSRIKAQEIKGALDSGVITPSDIGIKPASTAYDPDNAYDTDNSIAGIKQFAKEFGIDVANVDMDAPDFEDEENSVVRVELNKHESKVYFQVMGDGKMAVFSETGQRLESFRDYVFFGLYSNDDGTLRERLAAFSKGADELASLPPEVKPLPDGKDEADAVKDSDNNVYWYGLRARPYGMGTVPAPEDVTQNLNTDEANSQFPNVKNNAVRHGALGYKRALTDKEIYDFELVDLNSNQGPVDPEEVTRITREALVEYLDHKGVTAVSQAVFDALKSQVESRGFYKEFGRYLRRQPEFKGRTTDQEKYDAWNEAVKLIDAQVFEQEAQEVGFIESPEESQEVAMELNFSSLESVIDAVSSGEIALKSGKESIRNNVAVELPSMLSRSLIQASDGARNKKTWEANIREWMQSAKQYDVNAPVVNVGGREISLNNLTYDVMMDGLDLFGANLAYVAKKHPQEAINYLEQGIGDLTPAERTAFIDAIKGQYMNKPANQGPAVAIDPSGLTEENREQIEQLVAFAGFKPVLGKQLLSMPDGSIKEINFDDQDDVFVSIDDVYEDLRSALDKRALKELGKVTGQQSQNYYLPEGESVSIKASSDTTPVYGDKVSGAYSGYKVAAFLQGSKHADYSLYPVNLDGGYQFAVVGYGNEALGTVDSFDEFVSIVAEQQQLSTERPEVPAANSEEDQHIEKLSELRDYQGEVTPEKLAQFQTVIEQAYANFEQNGTIPENEGLLNAAFERHVALQSELKV